MLLPESFRPPQCTHFPGAERARSTNECTSPEEVHLLDLMHFLSFARTLDSHFPWDKSEWWKNKTENESFSTHTKARTMMTTSNVSGILSLSTSSPKKNPPELDTFRDHLARGHLLVAAGPEDKPAAQGGSILIKMNNSTGIVGAVWECKSFAWVEGCGWRRTQTESF